MYCVVVECPTCGAPRGQACFNPKTGNRRKVASVHPQRRYAGKAIFKARPVLYEKLAAQIRAEEGNGGQDKDGIVSPDAPVA